MPKLIMVENLPCLLKELPLFFRGIASCLYGLFETYIGMLRKLKGRTFFRMRLPLAFFIIMVLGSCGASSAILFSASAAHSHGDYFRLETKYLNADFPKNWFAFSWERKNVSGNIYGVLFAPPYQRAAMFILIFDEKVTETYLEENNVTDSFSVILFEAKRLYNWTLKENENATLRFIENGTYRVSGYEANFSTFVIEGVIEEGNLYDWKWTFISFVNKRLFQIAFYGIKEDYDLVHDIFQIVANSTVIKE